MANLGEGILQHAGQVSFLRVAIPVVNQIDRTRCDLRRQSD